ncbi:MAG: hypothetical protein A2X77_02820 [Gammaproteobacteria bacterium GWE2_42_36]|nr:MAG: hypothetical protein A2X77_02820 [Gammaproteobacteria bacterium GWE2_42_36]HCU05816.1 amino acid permease [Coxiellaceae bacterium]
MRQNKVLSVFSLAMIAMAGIVNIRSFPMMASMGLNLVFFYLLAGLFFLLPSALVCAELSTMLPEAGGMYRWIKTAFGEGVGFIAIWTEWFNNVIGFPATISFVTAAIAYIVAPHWAHSKFYMFGGMLLITWSVTLFNLLGIKASSRLNMIGVVFGTLLPVVVIVILAIKWMIAGNPVQIHFSLAAFLPEMHFKSFAFFVGALSSYAGMQIIAFHSQNVEKPNKTFPKAILSSVTIILLITILGALAIAMVVPKNQLDLINGMFDGFQIFLNQFHLAWLLPVLVGLIAISCISGLSAWLLGPARGLVVAAQQGLFPSWCAKENKHGMPKNILFLQAVIITALSMLFIVMPNFNSAFWVLVVTTGQLTMIVYILMFASIIRLRYSHSQAERPFKISGGLFGIWLIAGISILCSVAGFCSGFIPPDSVQISLKEYELIIIAGNAVYLLIPFLIYHYFTKHSLRRRLLG